MRVAVRADHSVPHASRSHLSAPVVEAQLGLVAPSTKIYTLLNTREHTHERRLRILSVILPDLTMYSTTTGAWLLTQRDGSHLPKGEPSSRVSEVRPAIADVLRLRAL